MNMMEKASSWISQIQDKGYKMPMVKHISKDGSLILFTDNGREFIAKFIHGVLFNVKKHDPPMIHRHGGHPPHPISTPHKILGPGRKSKDVISAEEPEEPETM